jgi:2-phospho-L-lactate/phosphoenolpyruvate guanylyltransferase
MTNRPAAVSAAPVCFAIVPYREQPDLKSRLAGQLSAAQRLQLARTMLCQVLAALLQAESVQAVLLVGDAAPPPDCAHRKEIEHLETGESLNDSVVRARRVAVARGATEVLIAHADLPTLTPQIIDAMIARGRALPGAARAALASCQHRDGTNLLWLTPAAPIEFAYGKGSRARHLQLLRAQGYAVVELPSICDVDSREDLAALRMPLPDQSV